MLKLKEVVKKGLENRAQKDIEVEQKRLQEEFEKLEKQKQKLEQNKQKAEEEYRNALKNIQHAIENRLSKARLYTFSGTEKYFRNDETSWIWMFEQMFRAEGLYPYLTSSTDYDYTLEYLELKTDDLLKKFSE